MNPDNTEVLCAHRKVPTVPPYNVPEGSRIMTDWICPRCKARGTNVWENAFDIKNKMFWSYLWEWDTSMGMGS